MDTTITFFINTNTDIRIDRDGRILKSYSATDRFPIRGKLLDIEMVKGENDLIFRLDARDEAVISLQEINPNNLLDESLKTVETINHLGVDKKVKYLQEYAPKYHGNGVALTDGFRGTSDYGNQLWQGWNGENAELVLDLGKIANINKISVGTLIDQKAWIFAPKSIICSFSNDGVNFSNTQTLEIAAMLKLEQSEIKDYSFLLNNVKGRFVKIIANKIDALPEWHAGKGGDAWIFLDEIMIE